MGISNLVVPGLLGEKGNSFSNDHSAFQGKISGLGQRGSVPPTDSWKVQLLCSNGFYSYHIEANVCRENGWGEMW